MIWFLRDEWWEWKGRAGDGNSTSLLNTGGGQRTDKVPDRESLLTQNTPCGAKAYAVCKTNYQIPSRLWNDSSICFTLFKIAWRVWKRHPLGLGAPQGGAGVPRRDHPLCKMFPGCQWAGRAKQEVPSLLPGGVCTSTLLHLTAKAAEQKLTQKCCMNKYRSGVWQVWAGWAQ